MRVSSTFARSSAVEAPAHTPANRVAARRQRAVSTYRVPQFVRLKPSRLAKLAWIFGLR
jgi:hypothetical protein